MALRLALCPSRTRGFALRDQRVAVTNDYAHLQIVEEQIQGVITLSRRFSSMADRTLALTSGKLPQLNALDELGARRAPAMARQLEQLRGRVSDRAGPDAARQS